MWDADVKGMGFVAPPPPEVTTDDLRIIDTNVSFQTEGERKDSKKDGA